MGTHDFTIVSDELSDRDACLDVLREGKEGPSKRKGRKKSAGRDYGNNVIRRRLTQTVQVVSMLDVTTRAGLSEFQLKLVIGAGLF